MYFDEDPFGSMMFTIGPIFIFVVFIIIIGMFIFTAVKGVSQWNANNNSPKLTVPALVVTKRTDVSRNRHHTNDHTHTTSSTWYYVTFQFESGDRKEFSLTGTQYGMLAEGDLGKLTFQGTRYLGFERRE